jgi:hypothetical protein
LAFNISLKYGDKCILFTVKGDATISNLHGLADYVSEVCSLLKKSSAILDCADMKGSLDIASLMSVEEYFSDKLKGKVVIFAYNLPTEWQHSKFSENVMHNRGAFLSHEKSLDEICNECERDCKPTE